MYCNYMKKVHKFQDLLIPMRSDSQDLKIQWKLAVCHVVLVCVLSGGNIPVCW